MAMAQADGFARHARLALSLAALMALICPALPRVGAQYPPGLDTGGTGANHSSGHKPVSAIPDDSLDSKGDGTSTLNAKQKRYIIHANFEKSKTDAAELATLAKGLREELSKPDADGVSLEVYNRIERIEKLAKKIRDETKGF
jgi:hypothetical protein